ncbi:MAG: glycosyltransferase family 2 protein [Methanobrevibacter sp.]|uniref:glycosyltransferase family 2 protein n=1 Tax=Methanobrevibacter sp. TaxID=66852 RepID=UPI0025D289CD|nr:glycosyltransferase family 2 protein [Methanobrevibacter sp.]MBE6508351.1 glycosyltransferase family 2 protein [Methanobrevibacter sp.]
MKSIVIIPAFNEEAAIGGVVKKSLQYADEVLVVDDGSSDNTSQIARDSGALLLSHPANCGKGGSLKDAFKKAEGYDIVVTIDGDGQHNPDEIPLLIKPIEEGKADFVNGSRYLNGFDDNTPAYRRVGQTVLDIATNVTAGTHLTDSQSGFRAFRGDTISCYKFRDPGFGIESEMIADASENNLRILEVPITVSYDVENSSSKGPVTHGVGVLVKIIKDKIIRMI